MLNRKAIEDGVAALVQIRKSHVRSGHEPNDCGRRDAAFAGAIRIFMALARSGGVAKGYGWTRQEGPLLDVVILRAADRITLAAMKGFEQQAFDSYPPKLR